MVFFFIFYRQIKFLRVVHNFLVIHNKNQILYIVLLNLRKVSHDSGNLHLKCGFFLRPSVDMLCILIQVKGPSVYEGTPRRALPEAQLP